jgi:hypothetical protein
MKYEENTTHTKMALALPLSLFWPLACDTDLPTGVPGSFFGGPLPGSYRYIYARRQGLQQLLF